MCPAATATSQAVLNIKSAGWHWPWHGNKDGIWPRLTVLLIGVAAGSGVAAAAHAEMTGPWPAFIMGVGAPAVIQGALSHLEVEERKNGGGQDEGGGHGSG